MARLARVVAVGTPHHVTQRGNRRQVIFDSDSDRLVCLDLLRRRCGIHGLALVGYYLMSNHIHLVAIPQLADSLFLALKHTHGRYATYFNALHASSGHAWQGRYYSCPLDEPHFWAALRYTELNPVRAAMVAEAEAYAWSSAAAHCGFAPVDGSLDTRLWRESWTPATWREYLADPAAEVDADAIRRNTHTGRPLGSEAFVAGQWLGLRLIRRGLLRAKSPLGKLAGRRASNGGWPSKRPICRDLGNVATIRLDSSPHPPLTSPGKSGGPSRRFSCDH